MRKGYVLKIPDCIEAVAGRDYAKELIKNFNNSYDSIVFPPQVFTASDSFLETIFLYVIQKYKYDKEKFQNLKICTGSCRGYLQDRITKTKQNFMISLDVLYGSEDLEVLNEKT